MDFEQFEADVHRWAKRLGLQDWLIVAAHEALPRDSESVQARTSLNWEQRKARIVLNSEYREPDAPAGEPLGSSQLALHEVLHVALCLLTWQAFKGADMDDPRVSSEEHALITRLSRAFGEIV